jgi:metallophosphoesterase superfamily enzyme
MGTAAGQLVDHHGDERLERPRRERAVGHHEHPNVCVTNAAICQKMPTTFWRLIVPSNDCASGLTRVLGGAAAQPREVLLAVARHVLTARTRNLSENI